jgi:hypothetical protein
MILVITPTSFCGNSGSGIKLKSGSQRLPPGEHRNRLWFLNRNRRFCMSSTRNYIRFIAAVIAVLVLVSGVGAKDEAVTNEAAKLLPDSIQSFQATGPGKPIIFNASPVDVPAPTATAERKYSDNAGHSFSLAVIYADSDSAAYSLLTQLAGHDRKIEVGKIGTASVDYANQVLFYRGQVLARMSWDQSSPATGAEIHGLAQAYAANLPTSEDDVPVLIKHLPPNQTGSHPLYAVSLPALKSFVASQPILDVLDFSGGTEAVVGDYGQSQVVIVEFTTPQLSIDNDSRIWTKIAELKSQGQPTPSAYRRVGNYSVFVFNAADEKTANALVDQVKYEQVVQWLGDDPHLYDKLEKYLTQTSADVLVAVLKSSGLSLVLCLGIGGLLGALLFRHRRAQRAAAYSDAGGSIRLNLDDLTGPAKSPRLLSGGERSEHEGR